MSGQFGEGEGVVGNVAALMPSPEQLIAQAFKPNSPMDDPDLFAGRERQLEQLLRALHTPHACPIILGDRGLGKTSLALQVQRATQGDVVLLEDYGLAQAWGFSESGYMASFFIPCTDSVSDFRGLLQRMVNELLSVEVVRSSTESAELVSSKSYLKVGLKILDAGLEDELKTENLYRKYEKLDLEEQVVRLAGYLSARIGMTVLFIVDEIDRINTKGLASFVKASSSDSLRFAFVGIGHSLSELISDHASAERVVFPVPVGRMDPTEIGAIVQRAADRLNEQLEEPVMVTHAAINRLVGIAGGFPWFVHVIAQEAFMLAFKDFSAAKQDGVAARYGVDGTIVFVDSDFQPNRFVVEDGHVVKAISDLPKNFFAQDFRDKYQRAVRDSYHREVVLRALARWSEPDIPTSDVYAVAKAAGVTNPSVYKGHLMQEAYGDVLLQPSYQQRGMVRFRNEMFKRYVDLRPSSFEGVRDRVNSAWQARYR